MPNPTVSFVVPCYKLAHFLSECVTSILEQSYGDFEVLIMDDCSPDNTAEVAHSFKDPRVKYIRNDPNLGALPNYNKGISLSRGKYVWLISADDYLRRSYVLERYVTLMETYPRVRYTFCPGVEVKNGKETGLIGYSTYEEHDLVVSGRVFLQKLLAYNLVLAPAAMARRECYEKISFFPTNVVSASVPIDFIWAGDWYLWSLFALHGDIGYLAEPMVCYRQHELNTTNTVTQEKLENCFHAEIAVFWKVKQKADEFGYRDISKLCLLAVAFEYARHLTAKQYQFSTSTVTMTQFEESLCENTANEKERDWIRARALAEMGARFQAIGDVVSAKKRYQAATHINPWLIKVQVKKLLLLFGKPGDYLRRSFSRII